MNQQNKIPTLFDKLEQEIINPAPVIKLNPDLSREQRDRGIKKAINNAEEKNKYWSNKAYSYLLEFLVNVKENFQGEDIRVYAESKYLPEPPSLRAWGAVILKAYKNKLIIKEGIGPVSNPKAHRANSTIWKKFGQNEYR